jgi:hypothetical protein
MGGNQGRAVCVCWHTVGRTSKVLQVFLLLRIPVGVGVLSCAAAVGSGSVKDSA